MAGAQCAGGAGVAAGLHGLDGAFVVALGFLADGGGSGLHGGAGGGHAGGLFGINRGSRSMCVEYSQGSASKNPPTLLDVLSCCLSDFVDAKIFEESEFEWWGGKFGYDTDSRKAEAIYRAVIAKSCDMRETFNAQEIDDLHGLFSEAGL